MNTGSLYDTILETEKYITPEKYLQLRDRGEINPSDVRYADRDPKKGRMGGFLGKLK